MEDDVKAKIEEGAAEIGRLGRLWRDPAARKRFEQESGVDPIEIGNGIEVEAQHQSGRTVEYHERFHDWARLQVA
jgi:hypothetical protein